MTRLPSSLADLNPAPAALLCDLWGVLHDGLTIFPEAAAALTAYRSRGGRVVLLTNAPRPAASVIAQLDKLGAPRACWDVVVSSGDAARALIARGDYGRRVVFIGHPTKDAPLIDGLGLEVVAPEEAEGVIAAGLIDDETETAEDYRPLLERCAARGLPMICGNPDLVIHRGGRALPCGGVLGAMYEAMGQSVAYGGKPHAPIYARALEALSGVPKDRILAIGDGINTDILGAARAGIPALFIASGIALHETMEQGAIHPAKLADFLARHGAAPAFAMAALR